MSNGIKFQQFVNELKEVGFPVDKVTGGDINSVFEKNLDIREAIYALHRIAENRRRQKEMNKS